MPVQEMDVDPATGEILTDSQMGISTSPEDRGEGPAPEEFDQDAFEAEVRARVAAEMAARRSAAAPAAAAPAPDAAAAEAEAIAAALAKANALAAAEAAKAGPKEPDPAAVADKVAEKVAEAASRQAAMDTAKPNGSASAAAAKPATGRQVSKPKPAAVSAPAEAGDLAAMFEADAGKGLDFKAEDLAIPRLYLLQDMSPQVKERSPDHVPGARPGMWFNTVTGEVMQSATLIPIKHQRRYVAWRPRLDNGGGGGLVRPDVPYEEFVSFEQTAISVRSYRDDKGLVEVVDTPELIALLLPATAEHVPMPVAVSFPKTKATCLARMMTITTMQVGHRSNGTEYAMPIYSNVFRLTQKVEGDGPQSYFVPVEEFLGRVTNADYFGRAKRLFDQFDAGPVHVADVGAAEQV